MVEYQKKLIETKPKPTSNKNKDWSGNKKTTYIILGASNHTDKERENNDFYATNPESLNSFLKTFKDHKEELNKKVWECACGQGHLSQELINSNYEVYSTDLINRGYGQTGIDFLKCTNVWSGDILTNPPFKYAEEFVKKGLELINPKNKLILFLKIQFLESKNRYTLFQHSKPKYVYIHSSRQLCAMNGEFSKYSATALCFAWFVWEKGFTGETILRWIK